jgi:hypothetical protein
VPGGIRTPNLLIRSQKLYPVELQALTGTIIVHGAGGKIVCRARGAALYAARRSRSSSAAIISQPIRIFSRSGQSCRARSFKMRCQKVAGSTSCGADVWPGRCGLITAPKLSTGRASFSAGRRKGIARAGRLGGQRDSNPQQPESQSGALPLSYGHRRRWDSSFRAHECKAKARPWHVARYLWNACTPAVATPARPAIIRFARE